MPTTQPANTAPPDGATSLSEIVKVRRRFLRSVSLERDFYTTAPLEGYIPTPSAIAALGRIAAGVRDPSARAVSLTGAYGTGKSACALLMTKVLAPSPVGDWALRQSIRASDPALDTLLPGDDADGFWPVLVTGAREPIGGALIRGLRRSLERLPVP